MPVRLKNVNYTLISIQVLLIVFFLHYLFKLLCIENTQRQTFTMAQKARHKYKHHSTDANAKVHLNSL